MGQNSIPSNVILSNWGMTIEDNGSLPVFLLQVKETWFAFI